MVDLLLEYGADVNANFTGHSLTPFHQTCSFTVLDVAVGRYNAAMTLLLLQDGAKIIDEVTLSRAIDNGGLTAWVKAGYPGAHGDDCCSEAPEVASNYDFRIVVEFLHLYGADLNQVSLHDAVEHYGSFDDGVIEHLLYLGADVHAKDSMGLSAISRAFAGELYNIQRCKAFAQLRRAYRAKLGAEDLRHSFDNALCWETFECVELVLEYGADMNSLRCAEGTCLHYMIRCVFGDNTRKEEFLKFLLNRGADVHLRDHESKTPLDHAVMFEWNMNIVKLLLDAGAKVQCKGKEGAQLLTHLIKDGLTTWFDPSTNQLQDYLNKDSWELAYPSPR
ncbi:hypothetical protein N7463_002848 [Penicillium fimorum]|uniref:Ankyrin repeat protein n=1 Tax=Penicillium fimorum TaxID=1882269 RepID=A0A9W9Y022_9EURO|nr:hypothetical protein N7463_002848 [Penicillium fimorum]